MYPPNHPRTMTEPEPTMGITDPPATGPGSPLVQAAAPEPAVPLQAGVDFLLAEYNWLTEAWRYTDNRRYTALGLYLTGTTIAVSAMAFLVGRFPDARAFVVVLALVSIILFIASFLLTGVIFSTTTVKAEYLHSLDLIRAFFVQHVPTIAPYVSLPYTVPSFDHTPYRRRPAHLPVLVLTLLQIWASVLLGLSTAAVLSVLIPITLWQNSFMLVLVLVFIVGLLVGFFAFIVLGVRLYQSIQWYRRQFPGRKR